MIDFLTCGFCWRKYPRGEPHACEGAAAALVNGSPDMAAQATALSGLGVKDEPAVRYDAGKPRLDLIDPGFLQRLGNHYGVGALKYADRNWEKGMSFSRCYASAQRHMLAFWSGEDIDEETGSPHVISAAWNMAALDYYMADPALREKFDDRPKKPLA